MTLETIALVYLACGVATFPLSIAAIRLVVSLAAPARVTERASRVFDEAYGWSVALWIAGALLFYFYALSLEHLKPCLEQRTNQISRDCRNLR